MDGCNRICQCSWVIYIIKGYPLVSVAFCFCSISSRVLPFNNLHLDRSYSTITQKQTYPPTLRDLHRVYCYTIYTRFCADPSIVFLNRNESFFQPRGSLGGSSIKYIKYIPNQNVSRYCTPNKIGPHENDSFYKIDSP